MQMTLSSGVVLPVDSIAELCRRFHVKELSVFGSARTGRCETTASP